LEFLKLKTTKQTSVISGLTHWLGTRNATLACKNTTPKMS